jgi:transcriptional regulator with GAF, ATPase, and Fis domain
MTDAKKMADERTTKLEPRASEGAAAAAGCTLLISTEKSVFMAPVPQRGVITLGRAPTSDVPLADESVSRSHAQITCDDAGLSIADLGTTNGTRVLGRMLAPGERAALGIGSVIEIGKVLIVVQRAGAAPLVAAERSWKPPSGVLIEDATMRQVYKLLDVVAPTSMSVLVLGETGVGKDVFAESIHRASKRASMPFLKLNCAALPESILESELFGHERGAFTGALQAKVGLFESADGGTVFLDELGELPLPTQAKLLRVLESGEVMRVGSVKTKKINFRLISATNRDLQGRVDDGLFRSDLFFRINGFTITIPSLRERKDDIMPLANHFLLTARRSLEREGAIFSPSASEVLQRYRWPGNIRELRNVVDRAALLSHGNVIEPSDLHLIGTTSPLETATATASASSPAEHVPRDVARAERAPPDPSRPVTATASRPVEARGVAPDLRGEIEALERQRILAALEQCGGNQSRAARMLGMARRTLLVRLDAYGVVRPRKNS